MHEVPTPPRIPPPAEELRLYYLDSARVICMLMGIPYHAAHIYESKKDWWIHSSTNSWMFDLMISLSNSFRMTAFFIVSGLLSALIIEKKGLKIWGKSRALRLGVPLLTALATIQLFQMEMISEYESRKEFWDFWAAYYEREDQFNIFHLWFLPSLIVLSALLGLVVWKWGTGIFQSCHRYRDILIGVTALNLLIYLAARTIPALLHIEMEALWGIVDFKKALYYVIPFFIGAKLYWDARFRADFVRLNGWTLAIGTIAYLVFTVTQHEQAFIGKAVRDIAQPIAAICLSQTLIALCFRFLSEPNFLTRHLSDATYSIYLFHHPVVMILGIAFLGTATNIYLEYAIIVFVAFGLPYLLHRWVIARSQTLSFLFNGHQERPGLHRIRTISPGQTAG
ncbi:MAG: acyltransferase family protein [Sphingobium sp.]